MNALEYLERLVSINSTRGNEAAVADFLEPQLERLGFRIERYPAAGRRNILASRGERPALCVYGHMDTVPVYAGWQTDPFRLTRSGDRLFGLGTNDMKGGIAALMAAIERTPRSVPLKVLFCYDEEYDSDGAWLVAGERANWFEGVTHIVSVETGTPITPTDLPNITLGRRGRVRYEVSISGFSAHGGNNQRGVSAISIASQLVPLLEAAPMAAHPELGAGSQYVARIAGGNAGLSVPDSCSLDIERHFVPPETVESVMANYQTLCREYLATLDLTPEQRKLVSVHIRPKPRANPYMGPYVVPRGDRLAKIAMRLMDEIVGGHQITYGRSVADDNIFATILGKRLIVIGPTGGNEHSPNEWVSRKALQKYTVLYELLLGGER
jgi:succinyl-diaminopimelate desuccinylase